MSSLASIAKLAGGVLAGQIAVVGFSVADTAMLGRASDTAGLGTLAVGNALYITLYVTLAEVMQALLPALGRAHGADRPEHIGATFRQGLWLAAGLCVLGLALLLHPQPLLALSGHPGNPDVLRYLQVQALALPAALALRAHITLGQAIARPLPVTMLQIVGLVMKLALNALFIDPRAFGLQAEGFGVVGCAMATCVTQWAMLGGAILQHRFDPVLHRLGALTHWDAPDPGALRALLGLGMPIGASVLVEVSAFTGMALFISHLDPASLAAHQIASSVSVLMYMVPLSTAIAAGAIVAQQLGAGDLVRAGQAAWRGVGLAGALGLVLTLLLLWQRHRVAALYDPDPHVQAVALGLLGIVAVLQVFDALQICSAFVLRAYHVAVLPSALYALALWGVGLGGGYFLCFDPMHVVPPALRGAAGFWAGNAAGLALTAASLLLLLRSQARAA